MQRYTPAVEQEPASPTASDTSYTYYGGGPRELPSPNTHCSSITTLGQEQQQTSADMVIETIATTTTSVTIQPESNPTILPIHRPPPHLLNELQAIYRPLYEEPLEDPEDLAALETLVDLVGLGDPMDQEDQEDQENLLLLQLPQQSPQPRHLPIMMTDSWGVYPRLTREIESLPEHSLTSWFTTSE
jgi:hypothetical protein